MTEEAAAVATTPGSVRKALSDHTTTSQSSGEGVSNNKHTFFAPDTSAASASLSAADSEEPFPEKFQLTSDWTSDEQQQLEDALSTFTADKYKPLERFVHIAATLPEKNVRDVGLRVKWMQQRDANSKKAEEQALKKSRKNPPSTQLSLARAQSTTLTQAPRIPLSSPMQTANALPPSTSAPAPNTQTFQPAPPAPTPPPAAAPAVVSTAMKNLQTAIAPLFDQNYSILNQCKANMAECKVHENLELLMRFRDNVLTITNHMDTMKDLTAQMPPLPVRLNTDLANSFLPKSGMPMPPVPMFPPPAMPSQPMPSTSAPIMPSMPPGMEAFCGMPGGLIPGTMGIPGGMPMPSRPLMPSMPPLPMQNMGASGPMQNTPQPVMSSSMPMPGSLLPSQMQALSQAPMMMPGMPGNMSMAMPMPMMPPPMIPMPSAQMPTGQQAVQSMAQRQQSLSQPMQMNVAGQQPLSSKPQPQQHLMPQMHQQPPMPTQLQQPQAMPQAPQQHGMAQQQQQAAHSMMPQAQPAQPQQQQQPHGVAPSMLPHQLQQVQQQAQGMMQMPQQPHTMQQQQQQPHMPQHGAANPAQQMHVAGMPTAAPAAQPGAVQSTPQMQMPHFSAPQPNSTVASLPQQAAAPAIKTES